MVRARQGLSAPIVGAAVENASLFFIYNRIQRAIVAARSPADGGNDADGSGGAPVGAPTVGELALSAAGAGAVSSFLLCVRLASPVASLAGRAAHPRARSSTTLTPTTLSPRNARPGRPRTPIELVKVKMQVTLLTREGFMSSSSAVTAAGGRPDFASLPGPWAIVRQTVAAHGLHGLWLGQAGTLVRETGGSSAWFTAFEVVSRAFVRRREREQGLAEGELTKADLKAWELCVAGAAAGMSYNGASGARSLSPTFSLTSAAHSFPHSQPTDPRPTPLCLSPPVVLFPADTVKSAMQTRAELRPDLAGQGLSFAGTAREIYGARGLRGLYAGSVPSSPFLLPPPLSPPPAASLPSHNLILTLPPPPSLAAAASPSPAPPRAAQ